ncbi:MAG: T9SS type A sorting domain-containing protein [Chlorobi bacterium]|nr:T9SS type A sorting domain-containing protein [Chlorobiota bacterium]
MKKILLFALALGMGFSTIAQKAYKFKIDTREQKRIEAPANGIEPVSSAAVTKSEVKSRIITPSDRDAQVVNIVPIGTAANAYGWGFAGGQESLIPVRPDLNTIAVIHRMGGDEDPGGYSGDLGYDISTDGGLTWKTQTEFWIATENDGGDYYKDAARYPNAGLFKPEGGDTYLTFFAPILWGSNGGWGGYGFGVANTVDTSKHTKNMLVYPDQTDMMLAIPGGYFLTSQGLSIAVDDDQDIDATSYNGNLIITKGYWNADTQDFDYALESLDAPMDISDGPADIKVAFSPDGQTGYISTLGNDGEATQQSGYSNYYPIYWKTTDAGQSWEGPFFIQLDGSNGIEGIVYDHLTDQLIADLFEAPVPAREDISYTTSFDHDIVVDANGNLHIAVIIGPTGTDPQSIVSAKGYIAAVDLFTTDGGTSWYVEEMGRPATFRGTFGDISEDNRIRITSNESADKIFISWLDTDVEDAVDNDKPNLWCRGFEPATYLKTKDGSGVDGPTNVTLFSAGMWQAYMGQASKVCFTSGDTYTIPFVYEDMDPTDPVAAVRFQYITDFSFSDADFTIQGVDESMSESNIGSVSQNYPNPFGKQTYVNVSLTEGADLSLEVFTLTGQRVATRNYGYMTNGSHTLTIDGANLVPGVYFYTVISGYDKVTRKMIVE